MPPEGMSPWATKDVALLRTFANDLFRGMVRAVGHADETFPATLETPYTGEIASAGADNTFLTYTQLRGKIAAIFGDDWVRSGKDLFRRTCTCLVARISRRATTRPTSRRRRSWQGWR